MFAFFSSRLGCIGSIIVSVLGSIILILVLLEKGVSIRLISEYLDHASLDTTLIYTHLTAVSEEKAVTALRRLFA